MLSKREGVESVQIIPSAGLVTVGYDPSMIQGKTIASYISKLSPAEILSVSVPPSTNSLLDMEIFHLDRYPRANLAFSVLVLLLSIYGRLPTSALIGLVNLASMPIYRRALDALLNDHTLSVDFLDALAHIIAQAQGDYAAVAFMAMVLDLGDLIRYKTSEEAKRVFTDVLSYEKDEAWVERDGQKIRIPVMEIEKNEKVIIYPGTAIPVDGEIISGSSMVDQKSLMGESLPVKKSPKQKVYAGTLALDGVIEVRADRVGEETSVARIVKVVSQGAQRVTQIEDYARKFGDKLVIPTLAVSGVVSAAVGDLRRFTSMIIVDFGTGIRIAAPTAVLSEMIIAARTGLLIKGGQTIEKMNQIDTVIFDKTGTLTQGDPSIHDVISLRPDLKPNSLIRLAAAAESKFTHPVALAILKKAQEMGVDVPETKTAKYHIGYGVESKVDGQTVILGSRRFLDQKKIDTSSVGNQVSSLHDSGESVLLLAVNGKLSGLLSYSDSLRPEAADVVKALRSNGVKKVVMLTGDNSKVAAAISRQLGLDDFVAEVLPDQKLQYVKDLQRNGHQVIVVGDGINDSPALTVADVGITVKNGVELAKESADIILMEEDLWKIMDAFHISEKTIDLIKQDRNILYAINTGVFIGAAFGMFTPVVSSSISDGASILATLNSVKPLARESKWFKNLKNLVTPSSNDLPSSEKKTGANTESEGDMPKLGRRLYSP